MAPGWGSHPPHRLCHSAQVSQAQGQVIQGRTHRRPSLWVGATPPPPSELICWPRPLPPHVVPATMGLLSDLPFVFEAHDCHPAMGSFSSGLSRQGTKDPAPLVLAARAPGPGGGASPCPGRVCHVARRNAAPGPLFSSMARRPRARRAAQHEGLSSRGSAAGLAATTQRLSVGAVCSLRP